MKRFWGSVVVVVVAMLAAVVPASAQPKADSRDTCRQSCVVGQRRSSSVSEQFGGRTMAWHRAEVAECLRVCDARPTDAPH